VSPPLGFFPFRFTKSKCPASACLHNPLSPNSSNLCRPHSSPPACGIRRSSPLLRFYNLSHPLPLRKMSPPPPPPCTLLVVANPVLRPRPLCLLDTMIFFIHPQSTRTPSDALPPPDPSVLLQLAPHRLAMSLALSVLRFSGPPLIFNPRASPSHAIVTVCPLSTKTIPRSGLLPSFSLTTTATGFFPLVPNERGSPSRSSFPDFSLPSFLSMHPCPPRQTPPPEGPYP